MLVTAIKPKEDAIMIGEDIKIVIIRYHAGQVHIGIQAPRDLKIITVPNEKPSK